jgi:hypothetical protein
VSFLSDSETPLGTGAIGPRTFYEDGTPQTGITLEWVNGSGQTVVTDTIQVQSDVSDVPELGSAGLLLAGLALLAGVSRLRMISRY